jgi:hypothetical protein
MLHAMRSVSVRPQLSYAAVLAAVIAAESAVLASRAYGLHPLPLRAAVIFDLCVVPAGLWWLFFVRKGKAQPRTIGRVFVLSVAVVALIFGRDVRLLAAPVELILLYLGFTSVRGALRARSSADAAVALRTGLVAALGDNFAAHAAAGELTVFWYAFFSYGAAAKAAARDGFTAYKRAGWTAIYVAIALVSVGEAVGVHFLLRRFGPIATGSAAAFHVYALLWMLGDLRALMVRPIRVEEGVLHLRLGLRWEAEIPLSLIERVELQPKAAEGAMRLAVLGSANLRLVLRSPVVLHGPFGIRRESSDLLLQVDEPERLAAALPGRSQAS